MKEKNRDQMETFQCVEKKAAERGDKICKSSAFCYNLENIIKSQVIFRVNFFHKLLILITK
jgi:hypothetical protein